jgi:RNA polymerase sigma-70 factor (ECF subfamily)
VVQLNRAVAVAEVQGPQAALDIVDALELPGYHVRDVVRADLLRRLDRPEEAVRAYDAAIAGTDNDAERSFLRHRRDALIIEAAGLRGRGQKS